MLFSQAKKVESNRAGLPTTTRASTCVPTHTCAHIPFPPLQIHTGKNVDQTSGTGENIKTENARKITDCP